MGRLNISRTLRISSRSLLNASATDAIQNFLNFERRAFSSLAELSPEGKRDGRRFGDGEREGVILTGSAAFDVGRAEIGTACTREGGLLEEEEESELDEDSSELLSC